jgi:hypothetical protein
VQSSVNSAAAQMYRHSLTVLSMFIFSAENGGCQNLEWSGTASPIFGNALTGQGVTLWFPHDLPSPPPSQLYMTSSARYPWYVSSIHSHYLPRSPRPKSVESLYYEHHRDADESATLRRELKVGKARQDSIATELLLLSFFSPDAPGARCTHTGTCTEPDVTSLPEAHRACQY